MKKIIIFQEHHGERVFDISTPEQLEKVALSVLKGRFSENNNYYIIEVHTPPTPLDFTQEQFDQMPEDSVKSAALKILNEYKNKLEGYDAVVKSDQRVQQCIKDNDGKLACRILRERQYHEDEGFKTYDVEESYV